MEINDAISQLKAMINTSLHYCSDNYDRERLIQMKQIIRSLLLTYSSNVSEGELSLYLDSDVGYVTPKVDIRSVVFNNQDKLLLVKEKSEGVWALPGGWADVGYSPSEIARKETFEEAGLNVTPISLYKVIDKAKHSYPKSLEYVYKFFFYCIADSYETKIGDETSDVAFFSKEEISELKNISLHRNTREDLMEAFTVHQKSEKGARFD